MTHAPSIVSVAPTRRRRSHRPLLLLAISLVTLAVVVVACTSTPATPGPSSGDGSGQGPAGTGPTPKPTSWPSEVVIATVALGAADSQFESMGGDMTTAVNDNSPQEILTASQSGLDFLKGNQPNIPKLQSYSETKSLGDGLAKAYADMIAGLQKIHDSLEAGDAAGVQAGFQQWASGSTEYAAVRQDLSDKSEQAIFMTRVLNR
ncbi:MAG TPA: hypothetical protein VGI98_04775 [Candidatus Limnocylindrales bacterium]|jgi:hypothetical protein